MGTNFWSSRLPFLAEGMPKEAIEMANSLYRCAAALMLLGGVTLASASISAPAFANDFSEDGSFGGTYGYIGPGASALPDVDVDVGPFGARVYVAPDIAFGSPADDTIPEAGWAPIAPQVEIDAGAY